MPPLTTYRKKLQAILDTGAATEHTPRAALEAWAARRTTPSRLRMKFAG
jgi:hypothetical protein